jgi:hypothetical protein
MSIPVIGLNMQIKILPVTNIKRRAEVFPPCAVPMRYLLLFRLVLGFQPGDQVGNYFG